MTNRIRLLLLSLAASVVVAIAIGLSSPAKAVDSAAALDAALYAKVAFFSVETRVPFAAVDARAHVAELLSSFPADEQITIKLAELDEALGDFAAAEAELKTLPDSRRPLLAAFYERRAEFAKSAAVLASIFSGAPPARRADEFAALVAFAGKHDLQDYLSKEFFAAAAVGETDSTSIIGQFLDKLTADGSFDEALAVIDAADARLSESFKLARRIAILEAAGRDDVAVSTYIAAFRADWTSEDSEAFYAFLGRHDRLMVYLLETKSRFSRNPAEFDAAARLIDRARYQGEDFSGVVKRLTSARAGAGKPWRTDELLALADYLAGVDDDGAVRMLYTIAADFRPAVKTELRREVLFRIFKIVARAGDRKLAVTRGSVDFLSNVASTDVRPGMTTAVLALIFSDARMEREFSDTKLSAAGLFNRAAAFRIMRDFHDEFPGSPELASMYLEIVRLYANSDQILVAATALTDFENEFAAFGDYTNAALTLAEAYAAAEKFDREREVLSKLLDRLAVLPSPKFRAVAQSEKTETTNEVIYEDVLARLVGSYSRERKTAEIITVYAAESEKYPGEQRLSEDLLKWLGETSITERESEVYRRAIRDFSGPTWNERYARWLMRNKRDAEFEELARSVVASFGNLETRAFLSEFVENGGANGPEARLYLGLYSAAHDRFPGEPAFVRSLLKFYRRQKMDAEWRSLSAEYFFVDPAVRADFLADLARSGELRGQLESAEQSLSARSGIERMPLVLFVGTASAQLSNFERAADCYRELAANHPQNDEFAGEFGKIIRSLGETKRELLAEAADFAGKRADAVRSDETLQTTAGEIAAELGDYDRARLSWDRVALLTSGENDGYLTTASVFWDYFRFDDALRTISALRQKRHKDDLFAFQFGAILEADGRRAEAFAEYMKAIRGTAPTEDELRAKRRLAELASRPGIAPQIELAYRDSLNTAPDKFRLAFNYADVLFRMTRTPEAVALLEKFAATETNIENLDETRRFFRDVDAADAAHRILTRLTQVPARPLESKRFAVELADDLRKAGRAPESAAVLRRLLARFPSNFGVISAVESGLWSAGRRADAVSVLRQARTISNPEFRYRFDRRIAERLADDNRAGEASTILRRLFDSDPGDSIVFDNLRELYVRLGRPAELRDCLRAALAELRSQKLEPREFAWRAADLHRQMLPAFLSLGDDDAAAAEYIEIINADPADDKAVDEALAFARRRGGATQLISYYKPLASEAFKNYRWNVVLAKLYDAQNDLPSAAAEYRLAIASQPEIPELYQGLFDVEFKHRDFEDALATANQLIEIAGESEPNLILKIKALDALGRPDDAAAERLKITPSRRPKVIQTLAGNETLPAAPESAEKYRAIVDAHINAPLDALLNSSDIENYVSLARPDEGLGAVALRLFTLHDKLSTEATRPDSADTGRAAQRLQALDAAFVKAVGREIQTTATFAEIEIVRREIVARFGSVDAEFARRLAESLGFDDLVEKILLEKAAGKTDAARRELIAFYTKRENYAAIVELLKHDVAGLAPEFLRVVARAARFAGDAEAEQSTLRQLFAVSDADDELSVRFIEVLLERDRAALSALVSDAASKHRLQTINLLLARRETELAAAAIANSGFPLSWKKTRLAEVSGTLESIQRALGGTTIGELLGADDERLPRASWLVTAGRFGRSGFDEKSQADFADAETERRPRDADAQLETGYFFHRRGDDARALEHFRLALALRPADRNARLYAGAALYALGRRTDALAEWEELVAGDDPSATAVAEYVRTLSDFGEFETARVKAVPIVEKLLGKDREPARAAEFGDVLRALVATFSTKRDGADFLLQICRRARPEKLLPTLITDTKLVEDEFLEPFLSLAAEQNEDKPTTDYDFASLADGAVDDRTAELLYDAANDFPSGDDDSPRLAAQQKLVEFQLAHNLDTAKTITSVENEIRGRRPRPAWLRLARIRLGARNQGGDLMRELFDFTGISEPVNPVSPTLPNAGRLAAALSVLREEKAGAAADELEASYFARRLAGKQLTVDNLDGFARASFNRGDDSTALAVIEMMTAPNAEDLATRVAALPAVAKLAFRSALPETVVNVDEPFALAAAAVTMTEFGRLPEAANYRTRLAALKPADASNRIELARLQSRFGDSAAAAENLVTVIGDRLVPRNDRWKALIAAGEVLNSTRLAAILSDPRIAVETEAVSALTAYAAASAGNFSGAASMIAKSGVTTPEILYLAAGFAHKAGDFAESARLAGLILARGDSSVQFPFASPNALLAESELDAGQVFAAFELAHRDAFFKLDAHQQPADFTTLDNFLNAARSTEEARIVKKIALAADAAGETELAAKLAEKLRDAAPADESAAAGEFAAEMRRKASEKARTKLISTVLNDRDF